MLGMLEGCSMEVLSTLATQAVRPSNYGPPRLWTQEDISVIGVVFAGLKSDLISTIPAAAMQGLQPHTIRALPASSFLALTPQQVEKMSFEAARAVSTVQSNSLSPAQLDALRGVINVQNEEFTVAALPSDIDEGSIGHVEETRGVDAAEETPHGGRAKGDSDPTSTTTEAPATEPPTTTTTHAPESEGEVAPKPKSGSSRINSTPLLVFTIIISAFGTKFISL